MFWLPACAQAIANTQETYIKGLEAKNTPVSEMPLHYRLGYEMGYNRGYEHGWDDGLEEELDDDI